MTILDGLASRQWAAQPSEPGGKADDSKNGEEANRYVIRRVDLRDEPHLYDLLPSADREKLRDEFDLALGSLAPADGGASVTSNSWTAGVRA